MPLGSPSGICKAGCGSSLPSSSHSAPLGSPVWLFELFFSTFFGNEASTSLNEVLSGSEEEKPSHNRGKTLPQERQSHSCPRDGDSQPWGGRVPLPEVLGGAGKGTRCPCSHTAFPNGAPHCSGCCPFISAPFWRNQTNYWLLIAGKALLALLPFPTGSREQPGSPQVSQRKLQGPSRSLWRRKSSSCCSVHPFPPSRLIPCSPAGEFGEPKCFLVIPVQPSSWGSRWASPGKIVPLRAACMLGTHGICSCLAHLGGIPE